MPDKLMSTPHNCSTSMAPMVIEGEIEWTVTRGDPARFDFRVSRPGHNFEVKADLSKQRATIQRTDLNLWGVPPSSMC